MFQGRIGRFLPHPVWQLARSVHQSIIMSRGLSLGRSGRAPVPSEPLAIVGLHRSVLGLGEGARLFHAACAATGLQSQPLDVTSLFPVDRTLDAPEPTAGRPAGAIIHLNPVELVYAIGRLGRRLPPRAARVGYWAWETTRPPDAWRMALPVVDDVWCPSRFTADALRTVLGDERPICVVPHPVFERPEARPDRPRFGIDADKVAMLCAFDLASSAARKNPMGALEAFARSGCGADGRAQLLVKVHGVEQDSAAMADLQRAAARMAGVSLLTERLRAAEMATLYASIDMVLSAHRAEGFGLVLAQAMAAGKVVVATDWSGNTDFMDEASSGPVACRLVPVRDPAGLYTDGHWAEPDLDHMARLIRDFVGSPARRADVGRCARQRIADLLGPDAWRASVASALARMAV